jgi:hypothetical protein
MPLLKQRRHALLPIAVMTGWAALLAVAAVIG